MPWHVLFGRRESGRISSRRRTPRHFAFQTQSVEAYFFQTTSVKVCGIRTTPATAYAFRMISARAFCLPDAERQRIFLPDNKCQGMWRPDEACHGIYLPYDECQGICVSDTECQGIFLADDEGQGIGLLDTVRQGISIDGCHCIYFRTLLASAHTSPNVCRPCVCVLDKDGHRSSLLGDDCQSDAFSFCRRVSSMWRPDNARHSMSFSVDECHGICLLDHECQCILPSRRRVSGHISSG